MSGLSTAADLDRLDWGKGGGLVTVVAQDSTTRRVLMVAHADREALERTLATGEMHYRSRTRGPWHKGATSGNVQRVSSLAYDCDADAVLAMVAPAGPACHTGRVSCFDDREGDAGEREASIPEATADALDRLDATIRSRARGAPTGSLGGVNDASDAKPSYTQRLLTDRNLRLKKLGEEAAELVVACADGDRERAVSEMADLVYHALVALRATGAGIAEVRAELDRRASAG